MIKHIDIVAENEENDHFIGHINFLNFFTSDGICGQSLVGSHS
jgi:hypothetical protein